MKVRHDNMLHLAHFLYTKAEPRLYYKPWEMSPEEEDRIDDQIAEARDLIQRERDEFEAREEDDRRRERRATPDAATYRGTDASPSTNNVDMDPAQPQSASKEGTNGHALHSQDQEMQDQQPENTTHRAANPHPTDEPAMDTRSPAPDANADEPGKDADEEVVEAAEDTVIY